MDTPVPRRPMPSAPASLPQCGLVGTPWCLQHSGPAGGGGMGGCLLLPSEPSWIDQGCCRHASAGCPDSYPSALPPPPQSFPRQAAFFKAGRLGAALRRLCCAVLCRTPPLLCSSAFRIPAGFGEGDAWLCLTAWKAAGNLSAILSLRPPPLTHRNSASFHFAKGRNHLSERHSTPYWPAKKGPQATQHSNW